MSATNRGAERKPADFYPTPAWTVARLLEYVQLPGGVWLEPGAGDGAIIRAVLNRRQDVCWRAVEIREECRGALLATGAIVHRCDFLAAEVPHADVCLGNPPYSLAADFIQRGLEVADRVVFLLRLNFLGSQERVPFFRRVGVPDVYALPDRPSFDGGGTDATEYAWMEFRPEWAGRTEGRVSFLYPDAGQLSLLEGR